MAKAKDVVKPGTVADTAAAASAEALAEFGWAVNSVKLNRAKAKVREEQPVLKGKALEEAVKAAYVESGGLLKEDAPTARGGKGGGRVQNMAADDGSQD